MNVTPQAIAVELAAVIPVRWGVYSTEIVWRSGHGTVMPSATVRAIVGPTPHAVQEVSGMGHDPCTAVVDLYNKARDLG